MMRIELRQIETDRLLASLELASLAEVPQPGRWLNLDGIGYLLYCRIHLRFPLEAGACSSAATSASSYRYILCCVCISYWAKRI